MMKVGLQLLRTENISITITRKIVITSNYGLNSNKHLQHSQVGDGRSRTQWKRIDDSLNLLADHKKYLEKVADLHKAHFKSQ